MSKFAPLSRRVHAIAIAFLLLLPVAGAALSVAVAGATSADGAAFHLGKVARSLRAHLTDGPASQVPIIIETATADYASLVNEVRARGGHVTLQYHHVQGLAASVPAGAILDLTRQRSVVRMYYDELRYPLESEGGGLAVADESTMLDVGTAPGETLTPAELATIGPAIFGNARFVDATPVWRETDFGSRSTIAIIDTGIFTGHFLFGPGRVVGGVDMSCDAIAYDFCGTPSGPPFEGFDLITNNIHGSHVAGIAAGNGALLLPADDPLVLAIGKHTDVRLPDGPDGTKVVALSGVAPAASLYIVKIFDHTGAGVSSSVVIAAIEHVIDKKAGADGPAIDIDAINMSLGGAQLFDGRDVEDQTVDAATAAGITVVSAAGNEGNARMTVSSPGSAETGLAVAAAVTPEQTRVFRELFGIDATPFSPAVGPGFGADLAVFDEPIIRDFSSRGPTADGRAKPDIAAPGSTILSAAPEPGFPNQLAFLSGTSMATPGVVGAVALLNAFAEANFGVDVASPQDFKDALKAGAERLDGFGRDAQGAGFLNVENALEELEDDEHLGTPSPTLSPDPPFPALTNIGNIPIGLGGGVFTKKVEELEPGQEVGFAFRVGYPTAEIKVELTGVSLGDNPLGQNSLTVSVHNAKRGGTRTSGYWFELNRAFGDSTFTITDVLPAAASRARTGPVVGTTRAFPSEPGFVKVSVGNFRASFDEVSAKVKITVTHGSLPTPTSTFSGTVEQSQFFALSGGPIFTSATPKTVILVLSFQHDWDVYPTSDVDMLVTFRTVLGGTVFVSGAGATLNAPERARLAGVRQVVDVFIEGFEISPAGFVEPWTLNVFVF